MNTKVKLTYGSMVNQCPTCGKVFHSITAFDKHRVGTFEGTGRRCLSTEEMLSKSMLTNSKGEWITKEREESTF